MLSILQFTKNMPNRLCFIDRKLTLKIKELMYLNGIKVDSYCAMFEVYFCAIQNKKKFSKKNKLKLKK